MVVFGWKGFKEGLKEEESSEEAPRGDQSNDGLKMVGRLLCLEKSFEGLSWFSWIS